MPFQIVILWTDALIMVLLLAIAGLIWAIRQRDDLRLLWERVTHGTAGMVGLTVLLVCVLIGLLDSMHYRPRLEGKGNEAAYAVQVWSVFDLMVKSVKERTEKTYSAPFAARLFQKETTVDATGKQVRLNPRLRHGGAHLGKTEQRQTMDLVEKSLRSLALAFLVWGAFAFLLVGAIARTAGCAPAQMWRRIARRLTPVPWDAVLITTFVLCLVFVPLFYLSGSYHVFGTDKVGQDVFYLTLKSIRTALVIGTLTTLVMLPFAAALGISAGYLGGWVDDVIQYIYTTLNSIPGVLLIAASVLMMQVYIDTHPDLFPTAAHRADLRLFFLCLILGVTSWTGLCRLLRGETLKLRELEFVQAAQAFGVRPHSIMLRHLLPNVMHIVLITVVMEFSGLVLAEAVLSYVGVGVDPSMVSFGTMINGARLELARDPAVWWSLAAAFVVMFALVLSANLFGDAVRDAFDPRLRTMRRSAMPGETP